MAYLFKESHIKFVMDRLALDLKEYTEAIGCSTSAVYRWGKGGRPYRKEHLANLEKLYKDASAARPAQEQLPLPSVASPAVSLPAPMPVAASRPIHWMPEGMQVASTTRQPDVTGAIRLLAVSSLTDEELGALVRKLTI